MVLVFAEHQNGIFKKNTLEAVTYAYQVGEVMNLPCGALVLGKAELPGSLGAYGAENVWQFDDQTFSNFDSSVYASAIAEIAGQLKASVVILPDSTTGKSILGRVAIRLKADSASGVHSLPDCSNGFEVKKKIFSGKAVVTLSLHSDIKILSLMGNSIPPEKVGAEVEVTPISCELPTARITVLSTNRVEGTVPLPEAEKVVSAGRGMKGPENWGMIEQLAQTLGATTACSRPVADTGWRPHHEHVGQTGIAIRPNLYIAIGISGAIQHLAGVNNSKTIVVINKDPEAPFFKAADYGVVGDLFEVVPKLQEALEEYYQG
jgi:electron transfer flavoprotein alpha subunit